MENDKKISFQSVLNNPKALMAISFLLALITWITISLNEAPEVENVIEHVKIQIDDSIPSQMGYEAFGIEEQYVDITVEGKRYLVGDNMLTADDFTVTAITTYVEGPGKYSLQLKATSKDSDADYRIVSKSQDYIDVYFDTPKTVELPLEPEVLCESESILYSRDYVTEDPIVSLEKITVTGPATEVDKIKSAIASITTEGELKSSDTKSAELRIVDSHGDEIQYLTIKESIDDLTVTVPVYKVSDLPTTVEFSSAPLYYIDKPLKVSCSPAYIRVEAEESKLENLTSVSLGTIDFSSLKPGVNTFELLASGVKDAIPLDRDAKYTVTVNTGKLDSRTFTIPRENINILSVPADFLATVVSDEIEVTIVGPSDSLDSFADGDIYAEINFAGASLKEGKKNYPATVRIRNNRCWAYGNYVAEVSVTAK